MYKDHIFLYTFLLIGKEHKARWLQQVKGPRVIIQIYGCTVQARLKMAGAVIW